MKRIISVLAVVLLLTGCGAKQNAMDRAMALRSKLQSGKGCSFSAEISADYTDKIYTFGVQCDVDAQGNLAFCVRQPQTIADITGVLSQDGGKLTFDDHVLVFPMLAEGQVSPISAPWLLYHTLCTGFIRAGEITDPGIHIVLDDSYEENAVQIDIYTDSEDIPVRGEILWEGRRIVTVMITDFKIL